MLRFFLVSIIGLYAVQDVNRLREIYSVYDSRARALNRDIAGSLHDVTRTWHEAVCTFCNEIDQYDNWLCRQAALPYVFRAWENEISASRLELNALERVQDNITSATAQYPQGEELGSAILDLNSIERRWKDRIESMERILNTRSYPGICVEARREARYAAIDVLRLSEREQVIPAIQRICDATRVLSVGDTTTRIDQPEENVNEN
jgi:hypothetical protein